MINLDLCRNLLITIRHPMALKITLEFFRLLWNILAQNFLDYCETF